MGGMRANVELVAILNSLDAHECSELCSWMEGELRNNFGRSGDVVNTCLECGYRTHKRFLSDRQKDVVRQFISDMLHQSLGL